MAKITGQNGNVLDINVDKPKALFVVEIKTAAGNLLGAVTLSPQQITNMLPSLAAAKDAVIEAEKARRKLTAETIRAKIAALQVELAEIEKL